MKTLGASVGGGVDGRRHGRGLHGSAGGIRRHRQGSGRARRDRGRRRAGRRTDRSNETAYFVAGKDDFERGGRPRRGPRADDESRQLRRLPFAAGDRRHEPGGQSAGRVRDQNGATNVVPSFITRNGPVREVRFMRNADGTPDGGVHALFTITGRADAAGCMPRATGLRAASSRTATSIFRIPTPTFGAGLIEQIPDQAILANQATNARQEEIARDPRPPEHRGRGRTITGQTNSNGNDGTIARFGWKAQNKSLLMFSGEAYNVEMGITNELFQTERDETAKCQFAPVPNNVTNTDARDAARGAQRDREVRDLHALPRAADAIAGHARRGRRSAEGESCSAYVGCALCHTPTLDDRQLRGRRAAQPAGQSVFRPAGARHGRGARRRRQPGPGGPAGIPDGAALGTRPAAFLPARRPDVGSGGGDPGAPERKPRRSEANGVIRTSSTSGDAEAGRPQLPAVAVAGGAAALPLRSGGPSLAVAVNRNGRAVDDAAVVAAEEQDHPRDLLRLRPLREIGAGHRLAVRLGVDDARGGSS